MTRRYTVTNIKTGETKEFIGGLKDWDKAKDLEDKWLADGAGVNYTSEPVEVCPTCKRPL